MCACVPVPVPVCGYEMYIGGVEGLSDRRRGLVKHRLCCERSDTLD